MYILFKNAQGEMQKVNLTAAKAEKCLVWKTKIGEILTLTPKYLKNIHSDQELINVYSQKKTKNEFEEELAKRNRTLYPTETGGASIYGLLIINEK